MARWFRVGGWLAVLLALAMPAWAETETTELVTYFPSATANVEDLRARRGAIGESLYWDGLDKPTVQPVGTFLVQGPLTIGTTTPPLDISPTSLVVVSRPVTPSPPAAMIAEFLSPLGSDDQRAYLRVGAMKPSDGATFGYRFHTTSGLAGAFIGDAQGTPLLTVLGSGHVGVGTTAPQSRLDIAAAVKPLGDLFGDNIFFQVRAITPSKGDHGRLWMQYGPNAAPWMVLSDLDDPSRIQFQQTGTGTLTAPQYASWIGHARENSPDLAIMGGNVGVGTTNPAAQLGVAMTDAAQRMGIRARSMVTDSALQRGQNLYEAYHGVFGETMSTVDASNPSVFGALAQRWRWADGTIFRAGVYGAAPRKTPPGGREPETYAGYFQGNVKINGDLEVTGQGGPVRWVLLTSAPSNRRITLSCPSNYVLAGCGTNHVVSGDAGTEYIFTEMSQSRCVGYPAVGGQREHRYSLTITCVSGVEVRSPSNP